MASRAIPICLVVGACSVPNPVFELADTTAGGTTAAASVTSAPEDPTTEAPTTDLPPTDPTTGPPSGESSGGASSGGASSGGESSGGESSGGESSGGTMSQYLPCNPDNPTLVACYDMEPGPMGLEQLFDGSSYANHGVLAAPTYVEGVDGEALRIGEATAGVVLNDDSLNPEEFTITAWVRLHEPPGNLGGYILEKAGQYGMFVDPNGGVGCAVGAMYAISFNPPIVPEVWFHVACTYAEGVVTLYRNGQEAQQTFTELPPAGPKPLTVGCGGFQCSARLVDADIDRVRMWSVVLDPDSLCDKIDC